ncbi:RecB family exonuclease [Nanoarchaeota archaeon]
MEIKARRVESPSSINTYNTCPRKYYYNYIERLPTKGNIHTIKGNVVHSVLETFFDQEIPENINYDNAGEWFKKQLFSLFAKFWKEKKDLVKEIAISEGEEAVGINDCVDIIYLWAGLLIDKMEKTDLPFKEAFQVFKPKHKEQYFKSSYLSVHGFVDVIEEINNSIRLMDYKTSSSSYISDDYLLQLGIYALLYQEAFNSPPQEVGIYFLRDVNGEKVLKVTDYLLNNAKRKILEHHGKTQSGEIRAYPRKPSYLCKWSTGQCDFYNFCYNKKGALKEESPCKAVKQAVELKA